MKVWALAATQAASASFLVAPSLPIITFSNIDVENNIGSWPTSPICSLNQFNLRDLKSWPSKLIDPVDTPNQVCITFFEKKKIYIFDAP